MKIAISPGQRIDCGRSKVLLDPLEAPVQTLAEALLEARSETGQFSWDPAAVRQAADRLRALVEKRGE
ncbi:MAG TPA: hypothetical protein VHW00_24725 [Thermoanaerobaculia bacterium]|nr:hypothetical protein [Thermoanaerobaculia bacterium]